MVNVSQRRGAERVGVDRYKDLLMSVLDQIVFDYGSSPTREKAISYALREGVAGDVRSWVEGAGRAVRITFEEVCSFVDVPYGAARRTLLALPGLRDSDGEGSRDGAP